MTLILLLVLGSAGAAASAWGLSRGGRAAQGGAVVGGLALLAVVVLALALDAPRVGSGAIPGGVGLLDGRLIPNDYLRFAVALWALDAALIVFVGWLAGGLAELRGLLPALLASIVEAPSPSRPRTSPSAQRQPGRRGSWRSSCSSRGATRPRCLQPRASCG